MPDGDTRLMELLQQARCLVPNRLLRAGQLDPTLERTPGACLTDTRLLRPPTAPAPIGIFL